MSKLPIEEYFKYHPPQTEERTAKHNAVNEAALQFARIVDDSVMDDDCKKMAMFAIQQARMFANQGITVDELLANTENA
jgi:hypothetical protein